ncbi:PTS glucose/sucrose transporter subunit IIB [Streptomyces sp. CBG9]|nr:PTS glucose/sucrose transporter subunit IIB [Streptomyces sp. CBG9]
MPAAGRTAIGSWRLRPIFWRPWKRLFHHRLRGSASFAVLIGFLPARTAGPLSPAGDRHPSGRQASLPAKLGQPCANVTNRTGRDRSAPAHPEGEPMASKAEKIVAALGGIDNIDEVEGCITRLRTEVHDPSKVDEAALKAAGAHGVVKMGTAVQVVIGTDADPIAADIEDLM